MQPTEDGPRNRTGLIRRRSLALVPCVVFNRQIHTHTHTHVALRASDIIHINIYICHIRLDMSFLSNYDFTIATSPVILFMKLYTDQLVDAGILEDFVSLF